MGQFCSTANKCFWSFQIYQPEGKHQIQDTDHNYHPVTCDWMFPKLSAHVHIVHQIYVHHPGYCGNPLFQAILCHWTYQNCTYNHKDGLPSFSWDWISFVFGINLWWLFKSLIWGITHKLVQTAWHKLELSILFGWTLNFINFSPVEYILQFDNFLHNEMAIITSQIMENNRNLHISDINSEF